MKREQLIMLALIIGATALAVSLGRSTARIALVDKEGNRIPLSVELADDATERQRGLMYRESLGRFDGMLFILDEPAIMSFWMKNTLIPLEAVFFDAAGNFVSSVSMMPCVNDPCPVYEAQAQTKYGLEVPAGFVQKHGVRTGWKLEL